MRALLQRVKWARVKVDDQVIGEIGPGILTLLGVGEHDNEAIAQKMIEKIVRLRIFEDSAGKMNHSLSDLRDQASHLIVSQFTLYADVTKGNRPSFIGAAPPDRAKLLYEHAVELSRGLGVETAAGRFQADMKVELLNDGPVTIWFEL